MILCISVLSVVISSSLFLIFLKRSLVFPILLFFSISLHGSLRKAFLSLLAILWNSAFKWVYLSFSPLPLASLLYITICKALSDNHFAFLHFFFFMKMVWSVLPVQYHKPSSIVLPALCLSDLIPWIHLSLPPFSHKGFDLPIISEWSSGFPYFLQFKPQFVSLLF